MKEKPIIKEKDLEGCGLDHKEEIVIRYLYKFPLSEEVKKEVESMSSVAQGNAFVSGLDKARKTKKGARD